MAYPNKSKMAAAAIFNFGKMSITPHWINSGGNALDKDICTKFYRKMHHDHAEMTMTKSRNRKLIPVTLSNERLKHKCVDHSYYKYPSDFYMLFLCAAVL